jgi:hypothetical protein
MWELDTSFNSIESVACITRFFFNVALVKKITIAYRRNYYSNVVFCQLESWRVLSSKLFELPKDVIMRNHKHQQFTMLATTFLKKKNILHRMLTRK